MHHYFGYVFMGIVAGNIIYAVWIFIKLWPDVARETTLGPNLAKALRRRERHLGIWFAINALALVIAVTGGILQKRASERSERLVSRDTNPTLCAAAIGPRLPFRC